jgi:foldase protein PrsA
MREKKMRKKIIIALGITIVLTVGAFIGCSMITSEKSFIQTFVGLNSKQMLEIDKLVCSTPEFKLVLMNNANQYKKDFGNVTDWKTEVEQDITLEEFVLNKTKEEISLKYALSAMAQKQNVSLTMQEQSNIQKAAQSYYSELSSQEKEYTGATTENIEALYTNYLLADKIYDSMTANIGENVSDEEARVMTIQYIHMTTAKTKEKKILSTMKEITDLVNGGYQEFSKEAKQYSEDELVEKIIKKNEATAKYEQEAFKLSDKQISGVIADGDDYYLVYCKESYMKNETEQNRKDLIEQKKEAYFKEEYDAFIESADLEFNDKVFKKLELPNDDNINNTSLLSVLKNNVNK